MASATVLLHWLPLGAGGHSIRWNGRVFEALVAHHEHRTARPLYHSALEVRLGADRYVVEMTPAWGGGATERGVVREGPVGSRALGRWAAFRYEVRRWNNGTIGDVDAALLASPRQVGDDPDHARLLLEAVPRFPALTWGRDELRAGDMWNSNSLTAWLLAVSGHEPENLVPPGDGRAPGWKAGLVAASRSTGR